MSDSESVSEHPIEQKPQIMEIIPSNGQSIGLPNSPVSENKPLQNDYVSANRKPVAQSGNSFMDNMLGGLFQNQGLQSMLQGALGQNGEQLSNVVQQVLSNPQILQGISNVVQQVNGVVGGNQDNKSKSSSSSSSKASKSKKSKSRHSRQRRNSSQSEQSLQDADSFIVQSKPIKKRPVRSNQKQLLQGLASIFQYLANCQ